jgi:hypothetical protein
VLDLFLTILLRRTYILVLLFLAYIWPAFSLFSWRRARSAQNERRGGYHFTSYSVTTLADFYARVRSTFTSSAINIIITRPVHGVFNEKRIIGTGREREKAGALNFLD